MTIDLTGNIFQSLSAMQRQMAEAELARFLNCPHDHYSIVTPQICDRGYYYTECRDCGATRRWLAPGNKTRAETIAEIQAMLNTEREQTT